MAINLMNAKPRYLLCSLVATLVLTAVTPSTAHAQSRLWEVARGHEGVVNIVLDLSSPVDPAILEGTAGQGVRRYSLGTDSTSLLPGTEGLNTVRGFSRLSDGRIVTLNNEGLFVTNPAAPIESRTENIGSLHSKMWFNNRSQKVELVQLAGNHHGDNFVLAKTKSGELAVYKFIHSSEGWQGELVAGFGPKPCDELTAVSGREANLGTGWQTAFAVTDEGDFLLGTSLKSGLSGVIKGTPSDDGFKVRLVAELGGEIGSLAPAADGSVIAFLLSPKPTIVQTFPEVAGGVARERWPVLAGSGSYPAAFAGNGEVGSTVELRGIRAAQIAAAPDGGVFFFDRGLATDPVRLLYINPPNSDTNERLSQRMFDRKTTLMDLTEPELERALAALEATRTCTSNAGARNRRVDVWTSLRAALSLRAFHRLIPLEVSLLSKLVDDYQKRIALLKKLGGRERLPPPSGDDHETPPCAKRSRSGLSGADATQTPH